VNDVFKGTLADNCGGTTNGRDGKKLFRKNERFSIFFPLRRPHHHGGPTADPLEDKERRERHTVGGERKDDGEGRGDPFVRAAYYGPANKLYERTRIFAIYI